jgi:hypothetical protein
MAISTSTYFSNSLVGVPQVAGDVDVLATHATPRFAVGTKFERQDGAVFRYAHFGAACTGGQIMCPVTSETSYAQVTSAVISTSTTYQSPGDPIGVLPNGIGSRYLVLTVITATAHQFQGGYVVATSHKDDGVQIGGLGVTYRIKDNTATTTSTPYYSKFELYDQLVATIGTSAFITIAGSKFNDLVPGKAAAATANLPAGVATRTQAAAAYGWVQTRGLSGVLIEAAAGGSAGDIAVLSTGMAGGATVLALGTTMGVVKNIVGTLASGASGSTIALMDVSIGA